MAQNWYIYADDEFITKSDDCAISMQQCPAIKYAEIMGVNVVYEPIINRAFNVKFERGSCYLKLANEIITICNNCKHRSTR